MAKVTVTELQNMKQKGEKIAMLTAYDATFSRLVDEAGVDITLIGDSLGFAMAGHENSIPVTIDDVVLHTRYVKRGNQRSLILADMPFMSYTDVQLALRNAAKLMQAGAEMVKIEGSAWLAPTITELTEKGVPVCAHVGLTEQWLHILGGHKIQGRDEHKAQQILQDALILEKAGARMLLLECMPHLLAREITAAVSIPTIGIGAGVDCDGQVLVIYDMLNLKVGKPYKFVKNFIDGQTSGIPGAFKAYVQAVKDGSFPTLEHSFS